MSGVRFRFLLVRVWNAIIADKLIGHAAELGFYFLFALFPTLFCASAIIGLVLQSGPSFQFRMLDRLAMVVPSSASNALLGTFNDIVAAASTGKITFGLIVAIWSASSGISALQDTLNAVHKLEETRSYIVARIQAISLTFIAIVIAMSILAALALGDFTARLAGLQILDAHAAVIVSAAAHVVGWSVAVVLVALMISAIYYWAPNWQSPVWHLLTPGTAIAIAAWLVYSLGFRLYLSRFDQYTITYGSLGAVIILMTWFYATGLMLLVGAEIDSVLRILRAEARYSAQDRIAAAPAQDSAELPKAG
ncbi:MAG: YihY/virulence factor BrkB family protein [Terracidiphilus sp.]